ELFPGELLDSMDGGRALQLKHEINVESTIIQRGTTKRDRDQPLQMDQEKIRSVLDWEVPKKERAGSSGEAGCSKQLDGI
ncbi:hypothetical protein Tco_0041341, partial [Tanacetum coccineum]